MGVKDVKKNSGGAYPIANKIPFTDKNTPPITGGTLYTDKKIFERMPFQLGNKVNTMNTNINDSQPDNAFSPNLFGTWIDVYSAWCSSYTMTEAPKPLKRLEKIIVHILFLTSNCAIQKLDDNNYIVGNLSIETCDQYGRVKTGKFMPWNVFNNEIEKDEDKYVNINSNNSKLFVNIKIGEYQIPLFLSLSYYINLRNILWQFKNTNLRLATIHKIIGTDSAGQEILEPFIKDLFNLNSNDFPSPLQLVNISKNIKEGEKAKINMNFTDLKDTIDINFKYLGNEINTDIETMTKEIFRVAGIRSDMVAQAGKYQERATTDQVKQSSTYFNAREKQIIDYFDNFSYDFKEYFGEVVKWESIFAINEEKEKQENKKDIEESKEIKNDI